jgi:UrcA family protein
MFHRLKLAVVAGIATTAFGMSMSAMSAETPRVRAYSVKVNYSDLDLTKEEDARQMLDRLERAASTVCGGNERFYGAHKSFTGRAARFFEECRDEALSRAVATVDSQELWLAFGPELRLARAAQ